MGHRGEEDKTKKIWEWVLLCSGLGAPSRLSLHRAVVYWEAWGPDAVLVPAVSVCSWGGDGSVPSPASPCSGTVNQSHPRQITPRRRK